MDCLLPGPHGTCSLLFWLRVPGQHPAPCLEGLALRLPNWGPGINMRSHLTSLSFNHSGAFSFPICLR